MAQEVTLTMDGMLLNWLKQVGDSVSAGETIAEFEADKATVEVEAPADGTITELKLEIGQEATEGDVIAVIGAASGATETPAQQPSADAADTADTADAPGETSDTAQAAPSAPETQPASSNGTGQGAATTPDGRVKASPLARRIAQERGLNLAQITGSGPGGRIVKADVENMKPEDQQAAAPAQKTPTQTAQPTAAAGPALTSYGKLPEGDDVEIEDISRMRRAIAEGTIRSFQTTPHFYVTVEMDVAPLLALRKQLNAELADQGIKISVNDMIVKAAALAQRQFPNLNSHYYGDKIVRHKRVNIAIAVALPDNGLVNLVSPDTDRTTLSVLATRHAEMFARARDGKIKPEDMRGGTFLVSNMGPYDVEAFSSIIEAPQAGALAVGSARQVPVVLDDGTLGVGTRMKVTLSIDHRVSDGAEGAQWLQYLRSVIEHPMRLLV